MEKSMQNQILIFVRINLHKYLGYLNTTLFLRPCHNCKTKGRQRFPKLFTKMRRIPNVRRWWYFTFDYVPFEKKSSLKEAVASPLDTLFGRYFSSSSSTIPSFFAPPKAGSDESCANQRVIHERKFFPYSMCLIFM